jgi:glycosyltransferase involved in cell wall biosynthesis
MIKKKVFIDFHYLNNLNKGFGQFSLSLSKALDKQKNEIEYIYYIPFKLSIILMFIKSRLKLRFYSTLHRHLGVSTQNCIFHSTNQLSKILPRNKNTPFILTIHDINFIYEDIVNIKLKTIVQERINRSSAIVYVSNFTKKEVNENFKVPENTIQKVIYNGNSYKNIEFPIVKKVNEDKFIFTISELRPYKNIDKLIEMMVYIPSDFKLVIAGKASESYHKHLNLIIEKNNLHDRVILKGKISEIDKYNYYKNCYSFAFPSSREGFGLPVVEALNFEKPIFLLSSTSLPEIGGDACFYWNNLQANYMSEVFLNRIIYFEQNKEIMCEKIKKQLSKFDWDQTAIEYEKLYIEMISN